MIEWLTNNWLKIAIPVLAFLATYIVGLWLRKVIDRALERWQSKTKWPGTELVRKLVRRALLFWFLLLGITIAIQISVLSSGLKTIIAKSAGSLFVLSLAWVLIILSERLARIYLPRIKASWRTTVVVLNIIRITIIVVAALIVLDIWGMPTTPLLLLIGVAVLAAALALRNAAPNLFAGFHLGASQQIKAGDYIKLETGEEGYVIEIGWNNTRLRALDESSIVIPNSSLIQHKVINYGHPLKKAKDSFHFYTRTHLTELTGLQAKNLGGLVNILKTAPEAMIYYHTHRFLEEHHYLTPEPSNDFAVWVSDALGEEELGERLASVNTFEFANLGALKERLVGIIEERLAKGSDSREAMTGREFYFMRSVSFILPTPYVVHDLREFVETLRRISVGSLYFHVFESRLRLGKGLNDFSIWLRDNLGEDELGEEIARLDPYTFTLEGLRLALVQMIEKRIK